MLAIAAAALAALSGCSDPAKPPRPPQPDGIHKIRHVVIIMQENRSFDSFFGTYPGADGIPARNGRFTVCVPDPRAGRCDRPYHDPSLVNGGGSHSSSASRTDVDGGRMDGFVRSAERGANRGCSATYPPPRVCLRQPAGHDGLSRRAGDPELLDLRQGLHAQRPHVRAGGLVEPSAHLYLVSGWSAHCKNAKPSSCSSYPAVRRGRLQATGAAIAAGTATCCPRHSGPACGHTA